MRIEICDQMNKQNLIDAYKDLKLKLGKGPSSKDFYNYTDYSYHDIAKVFPSNPYSSLVKECGDTPQEFGSDKIDLIDIMTNYGNLIREIKRIPTISEWKFHNMRPNVTNLRRNHGVNWSEMPQLFKEFATEPNWSDVLKYIPEINNNENDEIEIEGSECYIYLMLDKRNGYYKIGISSNPQFREKTLQSEQPKIELIAKKKYVNRKIAGAIEKALHNVYQHKHQRGEWFRLDEEDLKELKETLID